MNKGKNMKSLNWVALFLLLAAVTVPSAFAHGTKSVTVVNNTSYTMSALYASPSSDSDWDTTNNLLAGNTIAPGQTSTITIADGLRHCHYDMMGILYGEAEYAYQYEVNACEGDSWTVSP
jgi:hypothetical protein